MRCLSSTSFRVSRTAPPQCRAALPRRIDDLIKYRSQFPTCCQSQHGHWPNAAGISSSSFFCNTVSCRAWISHPLYRFALHKPFFFFFFWLTPSLLPLHPYTIVAIPGCISAPGSGEYLRFVVCLNGPSLFACLLSWDSRSRGLSKDTKLFSFCRFSGFCVSSSLFEEIESLV